MNLLAYFIGKVHFQQVIFVRIWCHDLWPLTSKSTQFIYIPNCTQVVNLAKFPQAICKILRSQTFSIWTDTGPDEHTENPKTECLTTTTTADFKSTLSNAKHKSSSNCRQMHKTTREIKLQLRLVIMHWISINRAALFHAWLVLRWVTTSVYDTSNLGQLSLAIPPRLSAY